MGSLFRLMDDFYLWRVGRLSENTGASAGFWRFQLTIPVIFTNGRFLTEDARLATVLHRSGENGPKEAIKGALTRLGGA